MYINFTEIVNKYGRPKGVIHIGAHLLEERPEYLKNGLDNTIWIEANPRIIQQIPQILESEKIINHTISDMDNMIYQFNITNNGQSSSILELDLHKNHHPEIYVTDSITIRSKRMDTIISDYEINIDNYDFINLDIQGAELLALKSFGNLISNFKYIYTEINTNYLYKGCALVHEIDEYLLKFGFVRKETFMTDAEWGDALYVKLDMIQISNQNLIFDIGAHNGLFTDKCLIEYPNVKIITVEANEDLYFKLADKYQENKNVVVLNYLVSGSIGEYKDFYISNADQISTASIDWITNSRFSNQFSWDSVKVKTITIDSLIKIFGSPTLIKVDVEGYELNVLEGLNQKVGEICFEWAEEEYEKINMCSQHLINLGYKNFGYTLSDEFLKRPEFYTNWNDSDFHQIINPINKDKWGMIWVI